VVAQHTPNFVDKPRTLIVRQRVKTAYYMPFYGIPVVAVAPCRFTADGCQRAKLDVRFGSIVHI
jgi:hypothetical protein